ncbi:MAG: ATP-binding protein [Cypionkella sp.]
MRPADLMRRTAFRLALGVTLFVLTSLVLAGAIGYSLLRQQLVTRQDARVTEIFNALQETTRSGDQTDLVEAVTTRIKASPGKATVYLLRAADGTVLASSIPDIWFKPGLSTVAAAKLKVPTDYPYRIFAGTVNGYAIVVGLTDADLDDLAEISVAAFGWSALGVLIAAIGAGALIAARVQARITEVETTLHLVAQGDLTARLVVSQQGNDLDQISLAINVALARLGGLVEAVRQVSADIAHDLRTPLNRLRIHIEAAEAASKGLPAEADLAAALAQSDAIDQTFSALLRIAQIESGTARARFVRLDLSALLAEVAEVYADVAVDAGMTLICHAPAPAYVKGDRHLLTQAFANLIENAIRHCPPDTTLTCRVKIAGQIVQTRLCDTGPGIPEAERENVLRRLYRLEKSRTTEGSGLGLALVKAVADLHDASLGLSDAAPGLCVTLGFPRDEA